MELTREQAKVFEGLRAFASADAGDAVAVLSGYAGTGKCLPNDQHVQTPSGPRPIGDLCVGDLVFGASGRPTRVVGVFPQGRRQAYRVTFRDLSAVECDIEHLWTVWTHKRRQNGTGPVTMSLSEILAQGLRFPSGPHRFSVPLTEPVQYADRELPVDPYVLGALIGDGTALGRTPTISTPDFDADIIEKVRARIPSGCEIREDRSSNCPRYRLVDPTIHGNRITNALRELGLADLNSPQRFIPAAYQYAGVEQRLALLRGLMDTDGSAAGNRIRFSTHSERLARDLVLLVQSLGGTAVLHGIERDTLDVNVKMFVNPFSAQRKASQWRFSEKNPPSRHIVDVQPTRVCEHTCIKVEAEDGLFLTEAYIVTHNTTIVGELVRSLSELRVAVTAPTNKAVAVLREKVGKGSGAEFATIHSLLGLRLKETQDGGQVCEPEGDPTLHGFKVAIVDECSMIDESMFSTILMRRGRCRVIFVGDPAQLSPVNCRPGEISPSFGPSVRARFELTEVVRQARENPVIRLATLARERITCGQRLALGDIACVLGQEDGEFLAVDNGGTWRVAELTADALRSGLDVRALAHDNKTVMNLNAAIHGILHPGAPQWLPGVPVIAQSEFAMRGVMPGDRIRARNSDILTVTSVDEDTHPDDPHRPAWRLGLELPNGVRGTTFVPQDQQQWQRDISARFAEFKRLKVQAMNESGERASLMRDLSRKESAAGWALRNRYADIRHAYAMTVHKSQGSTFGAVVLDWGSFERCPDINARTRLLYVALTRTARFAVICA